MWVRLTYTTICGILYMGLKRVSETMLDKRKKYYLVVDVETANDLDFPLVYDVGFLVGDKQGNILEKFSFSVSEMFDHYQDLLQSAYYAEKLPSYATEEATGQRIKTSFFSMRKVFIDILKKYNIKEVYAYNASFDRRALNTTQRYLTKSKYRWFFPYGIKFKCIWNMACTTIFQQKTFKKMAQAKNWKTASGLNISSNAETAYKYITGEDNFIEQHKGIDDVLIEYEILLRCVNQHKKIKTNINPACWRLVQ